MPDRIPGDVILEPNERVLIASRPLVLWELWVLGLLVLVVLAVVLGNDQPLLAGVLALAAVALALWLLIRWVSWRARWFILTDRRVVTRWGVFNRHQTALLLGHIQDAQLARPFPLSLIRDYGVIHVETAGEMSDEKISAGLRDLKMTRASEFYRMFTDAMTPETGARSPGV
ncbi:MAG TPA: PH domain-containing protein [Candidatus Limnocylindria bacterium]|nr:PH domain-containing protein [Candidatus Limnocylindria bacterium]